MTLPTKFAGALRLESVPHGVVVVADSQARERVVEQLVGTIAAALGLASDNVAIERCKGEAPRVARTDGGDCGAWRVSLSDTRGMWLGSAAEFPVGIDVEAIDPAFAWQNVADELFSPAMRASWATLAEPEQRRAFFRAWVRWEACLKCRGLGFTRSPLPPDGAEQGLAVHDLDLGDGFAAAVAVSPAAGHGPRSP